MADLDHLKPLLDLGEIFPGQVVDPSVVLPESDKFKLSLVFDPSLNAVKLADAPAYVNNVANAPLASELQAVVTDVLKRAQLNSGDIWLDVACNDGTLLQAVPSDIVKLGLDYDDTFLEQSKKIATVATGKLGLDTFKRTEYTEKVKVITCINAFQRESDPVKLIQDFEQILDQNGLLVLQVPYAPLQVQQLAYDLISPDQVVYYGVLELALLLMQNNFMLVDADIVTDNQGSIRLYAVRSNAKPSSYGTDLLRQIAYWKTDSIMNMEKTYCDLSNTALWTEYGRRIKSTRADVEKFFRDCKTRGSTVYALGSSNRAAQTLQILNITKDQIVSLGDTAGVVGKQTVGTDIPVVDVKSVLNNRPDFIIALEWYNLQATLKTCADYLDQGGTLVVLQPELQLITKEDL